MEMDLMTNGKMILSCGTPTIRFGFTPDLVNWFMRKAITKTIGLVSLKAHHFLKEATIT
jgi:hypothetical protein